MSKYEVMALLRKEFEDEILPLYNNQILPRIRTLIINRSANEKDIVTLGWETIKSKSLNVFKILKRGDKEHHFPIFVAEFRWKNKLCFANFAPEGSVVVYQAHCLSRYAERVLENDINAISVFYNYIVECQFGAYRIVLPSKTHKCSFILESQTHCF